MSTHDEPGRELSLRASDEERERIVSLLNTAVSEGRLTLAEFSERSGAVYSSRTRADLQELVEDLPVAPNVTTSAPGSESERTEHVPIGAIKRSGRWRLPARSTLGVSIGPIKLDLRDAELDAADVTINASTAIGTIKVVVPDNVRLIVDGNSSLGTRTIAENQLPAHIPAPTIRLRLDTSIGTVKVYVDDGKRRYYF
ncbi:DUF1707 SHOCT-like domain-containing protein [Stackebrandtia soli]|uniref:DUF1707 SHOCT-like domain-containing protein n=1 Tax=Stackebrandtia soli TaxID=1892856 RepID=UPI0039E7538E